eukprot:3658470-Rhodomonas_salina.1
MDMRVCRHVCSRRHALLRAAHAAGRKQYAVKACAGGVYEYGKQGSGELVGGKCGQRSKVKGQTKAASGRTRGRYVVERDVNAYADLEALHVGCRRVFLVQHRPHLPHPARISRIRAPKRRMYCTYLTHPCFPHAA